MSKPQGYRQSAVEAAFYALVFCLPWYRTLLLEGFGRAICVLLLACLLLFLVVRSAEVCRVLAVWLGSIPTSRFDPVGNRDYRTIRLVSLTTPAAPSLAPLYQRPPPIFS